MPKKVLLAIDSFKGSLSSLEVETMVEKGIRKTCPDAMITKIPVADGGEGTVDAIVAGCQGSYEKVRVLDPLGRPIEAKYGIIPGNIAVMEMAMASGITLLASDELNPMLTSTYGTGQMIADALDRGADEIYIGVGGSATNDGGMGMAMALGVRFLDKEGQELLPKAASLAKIETIDISHLHPKLQETRIRILSDVKNPLCGLEGASYIYGRQKGADEAMIEELDQALRHFAELVEKQLGKDYIDTPGAGAAGGLGYGLLVFTQAEMKSGIDVVLDLIKLDDHIKDQDLIVTGEGRMDNQTAFGKTPVGVSMAGKRHGVPTVAVVGSIALDTEAVYDKGISLVLDIVHQPMTLEQAITNAKPLVENAGKTIGRLLRDWTYIQ